MRLDQLALCVFHHFKSPLWEKRTRARPETRLYGRHQALGKQCHRRADHSCLYTPLLHMHVSPQPGRETQTSPCLKQIHSVNSPKSACLLSVNWINKVIVWVNGCSRRSHTLSCLCTWSRGHSASSLAHYPILTSPFPLFHLLTHTFLNTEKAAGVWKWQELEGVKGKRKKAQFERDEMPFTHTNTQHRIIPWLVMEAYDHTQNIKPEHPSIREASDYSGWVIFTTREILASGDAAQPGAEACCLGQTLRGSQVSSQHSWPQQMALDVNRFNCVGFVSSASQKGTPAGTSMFSLTDQKCKLGQAGEDPIFKKGKLGYICN